MVDEEAIDILTLVTREVEEVTQHYSMAQTFCAVLAVVVVL
jgi:hypothetical protein